MNFINKYSGPDSKLKYGSCCSRSVRKLILNPTSFFLFLFLFYLFIIIFLFYFVLFCFFDCMMVSGCLVPIVANSLPAIWQVGVGPKKARYPMQQQLQHGGVINNRKIAPYSSVPFAIAPEIKPF